MRNVIGEGSACLVWWWGSDRPSCTWVDVLVTRGARRARRSEKIDGGSSRQPYRREDPKQTPTRQLGTRVGVTVERRIVYHEHSMTETQLFLQTGCLERQPVWGEAATSHSETPALVRIPTKGTPTPRQLWWGANEAFCAPASGSYRKDQIILTEEAPHDPAHGSPGRPR